MQELFVSYLSVMALDHSAEDSALGGFRLWLFLGLRKWVRALVIDVALVKITTSNWFDCQPEVLGQPRAKNTRQIIPVITVELTSIEETSHNKSSIVVYQIDLSKWVDRITLIAVDVANASICFIFGMSSYLLFSSNRIFV